jgi:hypothetical protein
MAVASDWLCPDGKENATARGTIVSRVADSADALRQVDEVDGVSQRPRPMFHVTA